MKYKIKNIVNKKTKKVDEEFSYRIGRICTLSKINIFRPMSVHYEDNRAFRTSRVRCTSKQDKLLWITTANRIYVFEEIGE